MPPWKHTPANQPRQSSRSPPSSLPAPPRTCHNIAPAHGTTTTYLDGTSHCKHQSERSPHLPLAQASNANKNHDGRASNPKYTHGKATAKPSKDGAHGNAMARVAMAQVVTNTRRQPPPRAGRRLDLRITCGRRRGRCGLARIPQRRCGWLRCSHFAYLSRGGRGWSDGDDSKRRGLAWCWRMTQHPPPPPQRKNTEACLRKTWHGMSA